MSKRIRVIIASTAIAAILTPHQAHASCHIIPAGALPVQIICDPGTGETITATEENGVFIRSGTVNSINQGSNPAYFEMTGGIVNELNQGGGLDIFVMTGGHLTGTFVSGDFGFQSGGRIGAVNLQAADNGYHMTGGEIDRFLYAQTGDDFFLLEGGTIGFDPTGGTAGAGISVNTGAGADKIILDGTTILGNVVMDSPNNPQAESDFLALLSGTIEGQALMGAGSDLVVVGPTFNTDFAAGVQGGIDGGDGLSTTDGFIDVFLMENWSGALTGSLVTNFETAVVSGGQVSFTDASMAVGTDIGTGFFVLDGGTLDFGTGFTLDGNLSLGGAPITAFDSATYDFINNPNAFYTIDASLYDRTGPAGILFAGGSGTLLATGPGPYLINGDVANSGIMDLSGGDAATRLRVAGDYTGLGGVLRLNSVLGNDTSNTDRLIVEGNTSGTTFVQVVSTGGGNQTNQDIRVVEVLGSNSNGQFTLIGDQIFNGEQVVTVGAYYYGLYQGGASTPTDGHWYLRSTGTHQPAVPLAVAYPELMLSMLAPHGLKPVAQRLGSRVSMVSPAFSPNAYRAAPLPAAISAIETATDIPADTSGLWVLIDGTHTRLGSTQSASGATSDENMVALSLGADGLLHAGPDGKLVASLWLTHDSGQAHIRSASGNGSVNSTSYGVGGALTWFDEGGFYLDGQGRVAWYSTDIYSDVLGAIVTGNPGFGAAVSLEVGQKVDLGDGLSVTPQAQLSYSRFALDNFSAGGAPAALINGESLNARLGVDIESETKWAAANGTLLRTTVRAGANLHAELLGNAGIMVGTTPVIGTRDSVWGELTVGVEHTWDNDRLALHADAALASSLTNFGDAYSLKVSGGFRARW